MNIVEFPDRRPKKPQDVLIWACKCGCTSFELHADGSTACANCMSVQDNDAGWVRHKPKPPADAPVPETIEKVVRRFTSSGAALRQMMYKVNEVDVSFVISCERGGNVRTWSSEEFADGDAVWWLDEQLAAARSLLLPQGIEANSLDMMRSIITSSEELHSIAVLRKNGDVSVWLSTGCEVNTAERESWLRRKLEDVTGLLLAQLPKETP